MIVNKNSQFSGYWLRFLPNSIFLAPLLLFGYKIVGHQLIPWHGNAKAFWNAQLFIGTQETELRSVRTWLILLYGITSSN
jgi:hypothetical protein